MCIGGGDGLVELFLRDVCVHQPPERIGRTGIPVQRCLVSLGSVAVLALSKFQISHLNIAKRTLGGDVDRLANVVLSFGIVLTIDIGKCAQRIAIGGRRLQPDHLGRGLLQHSHVALPHRGAGQGALRIEEIGTQTQCLPPFALGAL